MYICETRLMHMDGEESNLSAEIISLHTNIEFLVLSSIHVYVSTYTCGQTMEICFPLLHQQHNESQLNMSSTQLLSVDSGRKTIEEEVESARESHCHCPWFVTYQIHLYPASDSYDGELFQLGQMCVVQSQIIPGYNLSVRKNGNSWRNRKSFFASLVGVGRFRNADNLSHEMEMSLVVCCIHQSCVLWF